MNNFVRFIFLFITIFNLLTSSIYGQETINERKISDLPTILDVRVSSTKQRARIIIDLSAKTLFALTSFADPMRLAIDVKTSAITDDKPIVLNDKGLISRVNFQKASTNRIRSWIILNSPAQVQQAYILDSFENQPARLVIDIIPATKEKFMQNVEADLQYFTAQKQNNMQQKNLSELGENSNPAGSLNTKLSERPLIIIDPGHGGIDSGARSKNKIMEKDIVLNFAKLLQQTLIKTGNYEVALTRNDDSFLSLQERVNLARINKADIFISIHADSFTQSEIGGLSIYTIDGEATNILDKILAEKENKVDLIAGLAPPNIDKYAASILVDLMRRQMRKRSFILASHIVDQLKPTVKLRRFPIRKADFFVLHSPDIPSILVELGFLSNMLDVEKLTTHEWAERVANSIARGIAVYFDEFERGRN